MSALDTALQKIERSYGKGSAGRLGNMPTVPVEAIPTGAITLDLALGIGGIPRGRIVEVYGPESSGKTTLVLEAMANAQAMGLEVAFIDAEHALDPTYAAALGLDTGSMVFAQPDSAQEALQIADDLVSSGELGMLVVDSVAALTPQQELDGEMGDQTVGLQARLMGQAMRKMAGKLRRHQTCAVFTNQIREKVGVMFGSPETTPGGRALKFYASQRLDIRRISSEGKAGEQTHNRVKVTVRKNKVAPPLRVAEFDIEFGTGISTAGCLIDVGLELGLVSKSGSFLTVPDGGEGQRVQGRANAKALLTEDAELRSVLDGLVRERIGF